MIVMAARLHGKAVFDGVYNRPNDEEGFIAECREGHDFGFDGKTLIHPDQIAAANANFGPTPEAVDSAYRLVAAANGGEERFAGRRIVALHVPDPRALLARAAAGGVGRYHPAPANISHRLTCDI